MNLIIQRVLLKLLRACWNIFDVPNNKFDEMLAILEKLFNHLKAQAPIADTSDTLTLQLNTNFQKAFDKFCELKEMYLVALTARASVARGGEGSSSRMQPWKPALEFTLRDDGLDDDVQLLTGSPYAAGDDDDSDDNDVYVKNGVVGLQAPRKFLTKAMMEKEQRLWSAVSWPSTLADVLQRTIEEAKAKTK